MKKMRTMTKKEMDDDEEGDDDDEVLRISVMNKPG